MCDEALSESIGGLLKLHGLYGDAVQLRPCVAGGNNRVYFVEGATVPIVAKRYFKSQTDTRNRLQAEWSFINYAYASGMRCIPRPIAADPAGQLALYERVDGRKMTVAEIGEAEVRAAADFVRTLNEPARRRQAGALPPASEAGFSIAEHFALIDRRLERLMLATAGSEADAETKEFVDELSRTWQCLKMSVTGLASTARIPFDEVLPLELRWISPSDFGFHNVLKRPDDNICFIDFEYAGWDDPAKLVADFFLQPQVPIEGKYRMGFLEQAMGAAPSAYQQSRIEILQPIFALKWCIIMMNPFVAERAQAGSFADPARDQTERKKTQLIKAKAALQSMKLR